MCLVHFWRVVGHCLGIEDAFNLGRGDDDFQTLYEFYVEIFGKIILPSFLKIDERGILLGKVAAEAHAVDYHVMVYKQCHGKSY